MAPPSPNSADTYTIVDPHTAVAELLAQYLRAKIPALKNKGNFVSAKAALEGLPSLKPRLVIIELNLGEATGLSVIRQLSPALSKTVWLLFAGNPKLGIQDAIKFGVQCCVSKTASLAEILAGVEAALAGQQFFCQHTTASMAEIVRKGDLLTHTEKLVLAAYAKGLRPREIAAEVQIGVKSVHNLTASIRTKIAGTSGRGSVVDLARYAQEMGLAPPR